MSAPEIDSDSCPRTADRRHEIDWASSDMTELVAYVTGGPDLGAVVRLCRCKRCGTGLIAVAPLDSDDRDPGLLLPVEGLDLPSES